MFSHITRRIALTAIFSLPLSGQLMAEDAAEINFQTDEVKASYGLGYNFGLSLKKQAKNLQLDPQAVAVGALDGMREAEMRVSDEDVQQAISALQQKQIALAQAEAQHAAKAARAEGEAYLQQNGKKSGVTTTESGLQYEVLKRGNSHDHPSASSKVNVHYHGTLIDGTVFDSSVERGEPISFPLNGVIAGWTEGVQLMSPGDRFRFVIPANLAYGDRQASPKIPPGSTLIFEVELLEIL